MKDAEERAARLREELAARRLDAYIITGSDPHQSEYTAPRWQSRRFISGFTGSAGTVIITMDKALLWVDSRYFIQGEAEISGTGFTLMRLGTEGTPDPGLWLAGNLGKGSRVGVDALSISIASFSALSSLLSARGISLEAVPDLLAPLWDERPPIPETPCFAIDPEAAGATAAERIGAIRSVLREKGLRWTFIASLDDIAWITGLRASDIPCNPVFFAYLFISLSRAVLFTSGGRFSRSMLASLKGVLEIRPYEDAAEGLKALSRGPGYFSPERIPEEFHPILSGRRNVSGRDISTDMKACKNEAELRGMRLAHIYDAAAFVGFLARLDRNGRYDEMELSSMLEEERKRIPGYIGPSFSPISAFREHGAMCHYRADRESNKEVSGNGLLVLDTGAQYGFGTTDITRTLLFGEASDDEIRDYTLVLKGHLALARQRFPKGTRGVQLDVLAKQFLWQHGETFFHGTGHGVGCVLCVHEGPQRISPALIDVPLQPGMVVSDEPGLYREGLYGIRIENLLAAREWEDTGFGSFMSFEVLTLVPYEKALIDRSLLTSEEISQIDSYHARIVSTISELVDPQAARWLSEAASPL